MEQLDSSSMLATPPLFGFRVYERDSDDNTMNVLYLSKTSLASIDVYKIHIVNLLQRCNLYLLVIQKYYLPLTDI